MSRPPKFPVTADQELAAPDGPVGAVTSAVEGHPDHRPGQPMFGHAGGHVRMVVLNRENLASVSGGISAVVSYGCAECGIWMTESTDTQSRETIG